MTLLPRGRALTEEDLAAIPEDGHRYELIDGNLVVTPAPATRHQRVVTRLLVRLAASSPTDLEVFVAPLDVRLSATTVLQPDVLVARRDDFDERGLPGAPLLAVEVASPSTQIIDRNLKKAAFERAGTPSFWLLDPAVPSLTVWELRPPLAAVYTEVAHVEGDQSWTATQPFGITLAPADLVT